MPNYIYQVIEEDGSTGFTFEWTQSIDEEPLTEHPLSGKPVQRVIQAANLGIKHSEQSQKRKFSDQHIEKAGFSRYERDKLTGVYHKTAGKSGPSSFRKPPQ